MDDQKILMDSPRVGLGGTFDHLHLGHQKLLEFAMQLGGHCFIGITTDEMTKQKRWAQSLQSHELRVAAITKFLSTFKTPHTIFPLQDAYGPTLAPETLTDLVVTSETEAVGHQINKIRAQRQLPELKLHVFPLIRDAANQIIHSERIRGGLCGRFGQRYEDLVKNDRTITQLQREELQKPLGEILQTNDLITKYKKSPPILIVIGDVVLETALKNNIHFDIGIFDGRSHRQSYQSAVLDLLTPQITVKNEAGVISQKAWNALKVTLQSNAFEQQNPSKKPTIIKVIGEEDLLAAAAILLAPLGAHVLYGQPNVGVVDVLVSESSKEGIYATLS